MSPPRLISNEQDLKSSHVVLLPRILVLHATPKEMKCPIKRPDLILLRCHSGITWNTIIVLVKLSDKCNSATMVLWTHAPFRLTIDEHMFDIVSKNCCSQDVLSQCGIQRHPATMHESGLSSTFNTITDVTLTASP